jgi:hypothetical protein
LEFEIRNQEFATEYSIPTADSETVSRGGFSPGGAVVAPLKRARYIQSKTL